MSRIKVSATKDGCVSAEATDGKIWCQVIEPDTPYEDIPDELQGKAEQPLTSAFLDQSQRDKLLKALPKNHTIPVCRDAYLVQGDRGPEARTSDLETLTCIRLAASQEETFPDASKLIPKEEPLFAVSFSLEVLESLVTTAKGITEGMKRDEVALHFESHGCDEIQQIHLIAPDIKAQFLTKTMVDLTSEVFKAQKAREVRIWARKDEWLKSSS